MPQMAPLNWLTLFFFFLISFFFFNVMNFYTFNYIPKQFLMKKKLLKFNWKW